mmetsp:Transcript_34165/g.66120  ORF Transcript_34165/g.66120 Transcript_34165/m.66120 type:complete len:415 (+) Transcript_34165:85-1329(+)
MMAGVSFPSKSMLVLCLASRVFSALDTTSQMAPFMAYLEEHGRNYKYGSAEFEERFNIFRSRMKEVDAQNRRRPRLWTAGINEFSDRKEAELEKLRGWHGVAHTADSSNQQQETASSLLEEQALPPDTWMKWSRLSSLRQAPNQKSCGSCWAVASSTVLQAHSEIYNGYAQSRTFSTQELVDCVADPYKCGGDGGCGGATVELAYHYVLHRGLSTSEAVPYQARTGACRGAGQGGLVRKHNSLVSTQEEIGFGGESLNSITKPGIHFGQPGSPGLALGMRAWERLPENNYYALMRAVSDLGPVAVSVAAKDWMDYKSGVFNGCPRNAVIDHAVTLVGYGNQQIGRKYWVVQNSWGPSWGEDGGKIRLLRQDNDDSQCGVDTRPEVGTGCKGGPKNVTVCGHCGILYDSVVPHFK